MKEKMEYPIKISQSWKATGWDQKTRKFKLTPTVSVKQNHFSKMKPVSRNVWFELIRNGMLSVTDDLRKWLDENGFQDIKQLTH